MIVRVHRTVSGMAGPFGPVHFFREVGGERFLAVTSTDISTLFAMAVDQGTHIAIPNTFHLIRNIFRDIHARVVGGVLIEGPQDTALMRMTVRFEEPTGLSTERVYEVGASDGAALCAYYKAEMYAEEDVLGERDDKWDHLEQVLLQQRNPGGEGGDV